DGGDGHRPQLEVGLCHAGVGDDVHAQAHADLGVVVTQEFLGSVRHVVHRHDRGGAECGVECLIRQVLAGLVGDLRQHGGRAGRGGCREEGAPQLLLRELGGAGERAEVQLEILRELRKAGLQVLDAHLMPSCSISILSMFLVGSFFCQLQAQTSDDWRASSTRRTSSTLRPTASAGTETNWMTLSGSTMKVARSATPSAFSTPSAWMSSCLMSDRSG